MNDKKNVIVAVGVVVLIAVIALLFFLLGGKSTYKVTFNSNGGSSVDSQEVKKGETATEPADPTRDGYTFSGWYLSLTDVTPYDFSKEVTENIELIAKWASDVDSGNGDSCDKTCGENETLDEDKCECVANTVKPEDPEKPENNTDTVAVTGITVNKSSISLTVGKSETITATVKPNNATNKTVTWSSSNTKVATVKNGVITAVGPGTATITVKAGNKTVTITVTVTAAPGSETKPQDTTVEVTFDSAGGTAVSSQTIRAGETVKRPDDPTRDGYTFVEWQLNGKTFDFNSTVNSKITLVAVWEEAAYTFFIEDDGDEQGLQYNIIIYEGSKIISDKVDGVFSDDESDLLGTYEPGYKAVRVLKANAKNIKKILYNGKYYSVKETKTKK